MKKENLKTRILPRNVGEYRFFKYLDVYGLIFMIFPTIFSLAFVAKIVSSGIIVDGKKGIVITLLLIFLNIIIFSTSFLLVAILNDQLRGIDRILLIIKYKRSGVRVLKTDDTYIDLKKEGKV